MALVLEMSGKRHGTYIFALTCGSVSEVGSLLRRPLCVEFHRLANELEMRAAELDQPLNGRASRPWIDNPSPFAADH